jgi:hypothetical protein
MSDYQLPKKTACIITIYCRLGVLFVIIRKGGFSQPDLDGYGKLPVCARGLQKYIKAAKPQEYLNGQPLANGAGGDFDNRYSQRGEMGSEAGSQSGRHSKEVHVHITSHVCNSFARRWYGYYHAQRPFIHQNIETTMDYCKLPNYRANKI